MTLILWEIKKAVKILITFFFPIKTFLNELLTKGNVNECRTTLVKNLIKESFYGKRKKKTINILIVFFISHKSNVKTFLKWILNQCHTALVNMTQITNIKK